MSGSRRVCRSAVIAAARAGSSPEMSPVTSIIRSPFSRRTTEKPASVLTDTMSPKGTQAPDAVRICMRSRKSARRSSSASSTVMAPVRVPSGQVAASIPPRRWRSSRASPSVVKPRASPWGVRRSASSSLS